MIETNSIWLGFILFVILGFIVLEINNWWRYGVQGMLSAHVRVWTKSRPLLLVGIGALLGWSVFHFWG